MPWLNGHVDDWEAKTGILKDLEVVAIPKTILVGPDGIISEGIQNEFATEVVNVELQLPFNPKKGEQMGKYLNS